MTPFAHLFLLPAQMRSTQSIYVNVNKGDFQLVVRQVIAKYQVIVTK